MGSCFHRQLHPTWMPNRERTVPLCDGRAHGRFTGSRGEETVGESCFSHVHLTHGFLVEY